MDVEGVKRKYRRNARFYDLYDPFLQARIRAVDRLALRPGGSVLDFGCGTGLSFPLLQDAIGPTGRLIGVELSPDMIERARQRVTREGWSNVALIEANAEEVELEPDSVDGVLCFYTGDLMLSEPALARAVGALRPAGRSGASGWIVAVGPRRATGLLGVLPNLITLAYSGFFVTTTNPSKIARPWATLERLIGPLEVEYYRLGMQFIVRGQKTVGPEGPVPVAPDRPAVLDRKVRCQGTA